MMPRCLSFAFAATLTLAFALGCQRQEAAAPTRTNLALPAADRLFVAQLSPTQDLLVGAAGDRVWAASLAADAPSELWSFAAPGVLQRVATGDLGDGTRVILAFGRGRGKLDAPLTVEAVHPKKGERETIAQWQSPRADFTHLSVVDGELIYAAYESKYVVREWRGTEPREAERMATSRAFADLDGDGAVDRVVGRIYGDTVKAPGDLRIELATGKTHRVPVEGGVRSLAVAHTTSDERPTLYFADGWSANYAREGRALLKRVPLRNEGFAVEPVVRSHDEYTFNRVVPVGSPGEHALLLYGSSRVSWLFRDPSGAVGLREMRGRASPAFGVLLRSAEQVFMASPGSPTLVEAAPSLR